MSLGTNFLLCMFIAGFDGSTTGDGNLTGGEGGAVGDAQGRFSHLRW